jgi:transposase-like protein
LCERRLDRDEFVALVLDGETFAADMIIMALGITTTGEKKILGFVQTTTENGWSVPPSCRAWSIASCPQRQAKKTIRI